MVVPSSVSGRVMRYSVLLVLGGFAWAQSSAPPLPPSSINSAEPAKRIPLDETLAELGKLDGDLTKKVETLSKLVDNEAAAGRITDPIAQSLQWSLRNLQPSKGSDFGAMVGSSRMPVENAKLMEAIKMLEGQWAATQQQRNSLIQSALTEARWRVAEATQGAEKASDVDPLIASLTRLQDTAQNRSVAVGSLGSASNYSYLLTFARALRRVVELKPNADPLSVNSALSQLQYSTTPIRTYVDDNVVQQRIQKVLAPYQKVQDEAQAILDQALAGNKSAAELATAMTQFEDAADRWQQARSNLNLRMPRDTAEITNTYRNIVALAGIRESGDYHRARNLLLNLRETNLRHLGASRAATYSALIATWEKDLNAQRQQADIKRREELGKRLTAVQTPAELEALASDVSELEHEARNDRDGDVPRGLGQLLHSLAAAWTGTNPQFLRQNSPDGADARFSPEIAALRQRVERDILVNSLRAPELNQPPLAAMPLDAAIDKFAEQLAAAGKWRRLLQLIEAHGSQERFDALLPQYADLANALRSFLAAQNFELAEQWGDAVQSYKNVLRSTSERAPVKESADRLKMLARDHPDAFKSSSSNAVALPSNSVPLPR